MKRAWLFLAVLMIFAVTLVACGRGESEFTVGKTEGGVYIKDYRGESPKYCQFDLCTFSHAECW